MKCDNCKNKEICKHVEYMQRVENKVSEIELDKNISIKVEIKCNYLQDAGINLNDWFNKRKLGDYPQIRF